MATEMKKTNRETKEKRKSKEALFRTLKKEQSVLLERELKRLYAMSKIQKIKGTVKQNDLPMSEIVKEVNTVREKRYDAKSQAIPG